MENLLKHAVRGKPPINLREHHKKFGWWVNGLTEDKKTSLVRICYLY